VPGGWGAPSRTQGVRTSRPPMPAPLPLSPATLLVSEARVSEEGICTEMPDLLPPQLLPPPGLEAGNQDTSASTLLAQGTPPSTLRHLTTPPLTQGTTSPTPDPAGLGRGAGLPVRSHHPNRPTLLPTRLPLRTCTRHPLPQHLAPNAQGLSAPPGRHGALPTSPQRAPQRRGLHRRACSGVPRKAHPKMQQRGTPWAVLAKLWVRGWQHLLLRRKLAQSRDLVAAGTHDRGGERRRGISQAQRSSCPAAPWSMRRYHFSLSGRGRTLILTSTGHGLRRCRINTLQRCFSACGERSSCFREQKRVLIFSPWYLQLLVLTSKLLGSWTACELAIMSSSRV